MAKKRSVKVYGMSGYKYQQTSTIMLKGYISVTCEDGRLVIAQDTERAALVAAEKEFMDREMKALQKRYEVEKKALRAQMVAEPGARW